MTFVFSSVNLGETYGQGAANRQSVRVATTANVDLSLDVASGDTVDGIVLSTDDRILIKNQLNGVENGIYAINSTGAPTRATDFAENSQVASVFVFVNEGTINQDTGWMCTNDLSNSIVGVDNLNFVKFASAGIVIGPNNSQSTNNAITRWDSLTGDKIKDSNLLLTDANNLTGGIGYLEFTDIVTPSAPGANEGLLYKNSEGLFFLNSNLNINLLPINYHYEYRQINAASYTIANTDFIIGVIWNGQCTITLPAISLVGKRIFVVTDELGQANKSKITIQTTGLDLIGDSSTVEIKNKFNSLSFYNNGVNKWYLI